MKMNLVKMTVLGPVCRVMNNIYTRWEGWTPNTLFETTIKKHIDKM